MAYIGNTVENQGFTPAIDYFNGNGVTVTFTLSRPIASVAQVIVAIDNVIQNPNSSFTVAGNAITFSSAPLSGTNNIWVEYTSLITTYQGISQDPTVIGDIRATGGYLAEGDFGNSFVEGAILDYVTGNGRLTVGDADGLTIYNGGTAGRTALLEVGATGNINIPGTGKRITGDFSNATVANRVLFQNSTANSNTVVGVIPSGTGVSAQVFLYSSSDPANASTLQLAAGGNSGTESRIASGITGTGTQLPMTFLTAGSERLRINTSGNVGIGLTSYSLPLSVVADANGQNIQINGRTGDDFGQIFFRNFGGANNLARIASDNSAALIFGTGSQTAPTVPTERMRINSSGNLLVNTTTIRNAGRISVDFDGNAAGGAGFNDTASANGSAFIGFLTGGTFRGNITNNNNTAVAYNTTSDYRLKENIAPMTGALATVAQLKPCTYVWKETGNAGQGFIAHELAEVVPDAVTGEKDAIDVDGNPKYQGVDTSFLVATLTAAIQEQQAMIEELKTKVAALEAK